MVYGDKFEAYKTINQKRVLKIFLLHYYYYYLKLQNKQKSSHQSNAVLYAGRVFSIFFLLLSLFELGVYNIVVKFRMAACFLLMGNF